MADSASSVITLTTDFGLSEHYVGAMKGAILSVNPKATIVDITHEVQPQRVEEGCFLLRAAWPYFPPGSVHVAIVDPGVGGERRPLVLATPGGFFVGPDNGILSAALPDSTRPRGLRSVAKPVRLPSNFAAVAISNPSCMRRPVSATFHGRDVFAPVAAHLTLGAEIDSFGDRVDSILTLPPLKAVRKADSSLAGRVIHVDRFGNVVTSIRAVDIGKSDVTVEIEGAVLHGLATTYGDGDNLVALIDSSGYLEVALPLGSAAQLLDADLDTPVTVRPVVVRLKRPQ
ncbi:MAG TPA: SAM-dependent chlorinase/fluorinase [Dehalococcoidia bacterium]|nr:SAM-dependent chlorinase/fluorinase [Dehalococcoidia bacterium]